MCDVCWSKIPLGLAEGIEVVPADCFDYLLRHCVWMSLFLFFPFFPLEYIYFSSSPDEEDSFKNSTRMVMIKDRNPIDPFFFFFLFKFA